ncbi:MAG: M48 family metallopeptidase [Phycisphaerae bacterium]
MICLRLKSLLGGVVASVWLCLLTGCVYNPATEKSDFVMFMPSAQEQVQMGLKFAPEFEAQGKGKLADTVVQNYVASVGQRVVAAIPPEHKRDFKYTFTVLNDPAVNAFALPGGPVYITRGLLEQLTNEAELAFVLGHEAGHVVAEHSARQMSKQQEMGLLLGAAQVGAGYAGQEYATTAQITLAATQVAAQMYTLKYSRDEEYQADSLGVRYTTAAGYDPRAGLTVMDTLERSAGGGGGSEWFATHPSSPNRHAEIQRQIADKYQVQIDSGKLQLNPQPYQQNVLRRLGKK